MAQLFLSPGGSQAKTLQQTPRSVREPTSPVSIDSMRLPDEAASTVLSVATPQLQVTMPSWSVIWRQEEKGKSKFVIFDIMVHAGQRQWMVHRRYSDFVALEEAVASRDVKGMERRLPRRRFYGNYDAAFLERRRADLEAYLQALVGHAVLAEEPYVLDFLGARSNLGADPSYDSFGFVMRSGHHKGIQLKTQRHSEYKDDVDCACALM